MNIKDKKIGNSQIDKPTAKSTTNFRILFRHWCNGDLVRQFYHSTRPQWRYPTNQPCLLEMGCCRNCVSALCIETAYCRMGYSQKKHSLPVYYCITGNYNIQHSDLFCRSYNNRHQSFINIDYISRIHCHSISNFFSWTDNSKQRNRHHSGRNRRCPSNYQRKHLQALKYFFCHRGCLDACSCSNFCHLQYFVKT